MESFFGTLKTGSSTTANTPIAIPRGATCSPISKAITIGGASTPPSATSPHSRQSEIRVTRCPLFRGKVSRPPARARGRSATDATARRAGARRGPALCQRGQGPRAALHPVLCRNQAEAERERDERQAIVGGLAKQLARGDKALIGNSAYRRYLRRTPPPPRSSINQIVTEHYPYLTIIETIKMRWIFVDKCGKPRPVIPGQWARATNIVAVTKCALRFSRMARHRGPGNGERLRASECKAFVRFSSPSSLPVRI